MNRQEHLLDILIEECAEVIQRCTKAKRFGLEEMQPGQGLTNERRIIQELCDVLGTADLLLAPDPATYWIDPELVQEKKERVEHFLEYSKQCGSLDESAAILDAEEFAQSIGGTVIGGPAVSFKNGADEFHEIYGDGVLGTFGENERQRLNQIRNSQDVERVAKVLDCTVAQASNLPKPVRDGILYSPYDRKISDLPEEPKSEYTPEEITEFGDEILGLNGPEPKPIDMIIFCPNCHAQHIDVAQERCERLDVEEFSMNRACGLPRYHVGRCVSRPRREVESELWTNPPHKSHLCKNCHAIFRVADVPTNGVFRIKTKGEKDSYDFKDR